MNKIEANTQLLYQAVKQQSVDNVRRLIPISDPKADNSYALRLAVGNGHIQCVELLIPVSDPKSNDSYALAVAAESGNIQCVALLIPVSQPKKRYSLALQRAVYHGHSQCVELLYPISNPVVALQKLQKEHPNDYSVWGNLEQMIEAEWLTTTLHKEIENTKTVKTQRKQKI